MAILRELGPQRVFGLIHCSGGAQTKCLRFGSDVHFIKDNLFTVPPIFKEIARCSKTPLSEMHMVYNMGHRLEVYVDPADASLVTQIADSLKVESRLVGRTEASRLPAGNHITLIRDGLKMEYPVR